MEMEYLEFLGFGLFALLLTGGAFLLARFIRRAGRNEGPLHGGGVEQRTHGVEFGDRR